MAGLRSDIVAAPLLDELRHRGLPNQSDSGGIIARVSRMNHSGAVKDAAVADIVLKDERDSAGIRTQERATITDVTDAAGCPSQAEEVAPPGAPSACSRKLALERMGAGR